MAGLPPVADSPLVRFDRVPTYEEFFERCLIANRPALLPSSLVSGWRARKEWATSEGDVQGGKSLHPAFRRLADEHGSLTAPVDVQASEAKQPERLELTVADAVDRMSTAGDARHYIKDWHLFLQLERAPDGKEALYSPPEIFQDDWMNHRSLIHGDGKDDFRFCYAGQAGTRTGLHADVYTSYSWSCNVVGKKRWRMFPPEVSLCLRRFPPDKVPPQDARLRHEQIQRARTSELGASVTALERNLSAPRGFARWPEARSQMVEFEQPEGTTVFVPSGWYHEVENLTDCISFNHNWCNSVNLPGMYEAMKEEVEDVEKSLDDVREMIQASHGAQGAWQAEWVETVQRVVKQDMGWAWQGFWDMVEVNLAEPVCDPSLRPCDCFVATRVARMLDDFLSREDVKQLPDVRATAERCGGLNVEVL